LMSLDMGAR